MTHLCLYILHVSVESLVKSGVGETYDSCESVLRIQLFMVVQVHPFYNYGKYIWEPKG